MSQPARPSKRFHPTGWTEKLVPVLLILLTTLLFGTILFLLLTLAGLI
ncbi:MAG: hypothetical protein MUC85_07040 [Anaerolineales bacterium]|nr:hypothetical protein [Anaerolineales bacterium]